MKYTDYPKDRKFELTCVMESDYKDIKRIIKSVCEAVSFDKNLSNSIKVLKKPLGEWDNAVVCCPSKELCDALKNRFKEEKIYGDPDEENKEAISEVEEYDEEEGEEIIDKDDVKDDKGEIKVDDETMLVEDGECGMTTADVGAYDTPFEIPTQYSKKQKKMFRRGTLATERKRRINEGQYINGKWSDEDDDDYSFSPRREWEDWERKKAEYKEVGAYGYDEPDEEYYRREKLKKEYWRFVIYSNFYNNVLIPNIIIEGCCPFGREKTDIIVELLGQTKDAYKVEVALVKYETYLKEGFTNFSITWADTNKSTNKAIWIPKKVVGKTYSIGKSSNRDRFIAGYCNKYNCQVRETYEGEHKDIENKINERDRAEEEKKVSGTETYYKFIEYIKNKGETIEKGDWFSIGEVQKFLNDECGFNFNDQQTYSYVENYWEHFHLVDSVYDDDFHWKFWAEGKKMKNKKMLRESVSMEEDLFDEFKKWFKREARKRGDKWGDEFEPNDVQMFLTEFGIDHVGFGTDNKYIMDLIEDWESLGLIEIRDFELKYGTELTKILKRYIIL